MVFVSRCKGTTKNAHTQGNTYKTCIFKKNTVLLFPSNHLSLMKYRFADIVIDSFAHCVMRRAQVVWVTNIEFRLLEYLAQNADQICSREDILNHVWGQQFQYDTGTRGWFPKNPKRK